MKKHPRIHGATAASARTVPSLPSGAKVEAKKAMSKKPNAGKGNGQAIDPETRYQLIAQEAYFRAERRGFASGGELGDWLEAERDIARMLG